MGVFGWLFGKQTAEVVATMPAADAEALAKITSQASGIPVTELEVAGLLLGGQIGKTEHIHVPPGGKPTITDAGRTAMKGLTVWIDSSELYVVRGKIAPNKSAKYLGVASEGLFVQSIFKEHYSGSPLGAAFARRARIALASKPPEDPQFTESNVYRDTKWKEYMELCSVAQEACKGAGHSNLVKDIQQLQVIAGLLISCWVERPDLLGVTDDIVERIQRRKRGETNLEGEQVMAMLVASWQVVAGLLQYYGFGVLTKATETELLQEFRQVVNASRGMQQKIGLGDAW